VSPGTDYSQQNAAQVAFTDLVIGSTTTQLTSAGNPFSSASPGNIIYIPTGLTGFTSGWYEVLSVSGATATMDRSVGTAASTGGTGNLGGSFLTVAKPLTLAVSGNTINIKSGTYTLTATLTTPNLGQLLLIGYNSTHADGGTKPLITTATNSTDLFDAGTSSGGIVVFDNLSLSNTAGTAGIGIVKTSQNGFGVVRNCKLSGFSYGLNGDNAGAHYIFTTLVIANTEIASCGYGAYNDAPIYVAPGSYVHGCTTVGLYANGTDLYVSGSVLDSNAIGAHVDNSALFINSVVSNSGTIGVSLSQTTSSWGSVNSIYYGNGNYGVSNANTGGPFNVTAYERNAWGANGTANMGNQNVPASASAGDVALTASPFVGSGNFALNSTAGGGAALKAAGFPGVTPMGTGYEDIGALQSQASAGGGLLRNPSLSGVPQ
jgi:hypothetical protein